MSQPASSLNIGEKERNVPLHQSTTDSKASSEVQKHADDNKKHGIEGTERIPTNAAQATVATAEKDLYEPYDNGYHFPPKHNWKQSLRIGAKAFWNYTWTPIGFFVVLYGLNVVAWGGMLFLLLCNASPAMCYPTCNDINSPRRKWVEWDSQIVNALFCVTGFGLAPWRFRDLYFLLQYRVLRKPEALCRLAGIHRGVRAPPTAIWKMDFVIWFNVWNTFLQCVLSGFMWGMNRYNRPSWATGLFVALACIAAATGGLMMFHESKKVKSIEGVPVSKNDQERLARDKELGIQHYNNIRDKPPKEKK
ncbi:hypothetical protein COL922a_000347 [Colletotrichum nupharicola]|nr:hypothetical protein COL922a_000347 [Colletotrichum nupharicola]